MWCKDDMINGVRMVQSSKNKVIIRRPADNIYQFNKCVIKFMTELMTLNFLVVHKGIYKLQN